MDDNRNLGNDGQEKNIRHKNIPEYKRLNKEINVRIKTITEE